MRIPGTVVLGVNVGSLTTCQSSGRAPDVQSAGGEMTPCMTTAPVVSGLINESGSGVSPEVLIPGRSGSLLMKSRQRDSLAPILEPAMKHRLRRPRRPPHLMALVPLKAAQAGLVHPRMDPLPRTPLQLPWAAEGPT